MLASYVNYSALIVEVDLSSLLHTNNKPEPETPSATAAKSKQLRIEETFRTKQNSAPSHGASATLIVAPTSLLEQWSSELQRCSRKGTLRVLVWHGQGRRDLASGIDVVITSYGVLASEHAKLEAQKAGSSSPIYSGMSRFVAEQLVTVYSGVAARHTGRGPSLQKPIEQDSAGGVRSESCSPVGDHWNANCQQTGGLVLSSVRSEFIPLFC